MIDHASILAISFDCYGTLIDWEGGIAASFEAIFHAHATPFDRAAVIAAFGRLEREVQRGPYRSYAVVLAEVTRRLAHEFGLTLNPVESTALADSIGAWPAFDETPRCLKALQRRYRLAIVSNIDDDLFFAGASRRLATTIGVVVTAEQVKSYKPGRAHFDELLRRLNLRPAQVLHVAESLYHDIAPARALGFPTVWVNRHAGSDSPSASGAAGADDVAPDTEVRTLTELCALMEVGA